MQRLNAWGKGVRENNSPTPPQPHTPMLIAQCPMYQLDMLENIEDGDGKK